MDDIDDVFDEDDTNWPIKEILDKRTDGVTTYYFVKRVTGTGDLRIWEPEDKLDCSVRLINEFAERFAKKKHKRKRKTSYYKGIETSESKKNVSRKLFPCLTCTTDSPLDLNRSKRGSVCDFR